MLWMTEAQAALGWGVLLTLAAVLGAIYLHQTTGIARVGRRVQNLQFQLSEVKRINASLELEIAEAQSLDRLQEEARRLGFVPADADDIEYLVVADYPVPTDSTPETGIATVPVKTDSMTKAMWLSLHSRIGDLVRGESP